MGNIGIGFIGAGSILPLFVEAFKGVEGVNLIGLYSRNKDKAIKQAQSFAIERAYDTVEDLLADESIDVVCILSPSGTHADYGIACAKAKKHVIIEKPIDVCMLKARHLIETCKEEGVKLSVIAQHRYDDSSFIIKDILKKELLGQLTLATAHMKWYRSPDYYESATWRGTREMDGGILQNQGLHTLDLLIHFLGPVKSVMAYGGKQYHKDLEIQDTIVAALSFESGLLASLVTSTAIQPAQDAQIELHGVKTSVGLLGDEILWLDASLKDRFLGTGHGTSMDRMIDGLSNEGLSPTGASQPMAIQADSHRKQLQAIIKAIQNDDQVAVSGEDALNVLSVIEAIEMSAESGRRINL